MATSTSRGVRVAGGIVCAVFAAFVLIHLLWGVGVTWGLNSELAGVGHTDSGNGAACCRSRHSDEGRSVGKHVTKRAVTKAADTCG